jgi:hypothetical protein
MAAFVVVMPVTVSGWSGAAAAEAPAFVAITLLAIWLTYLGFGSIAGWAFRFAWVQLGALRTLMSRALPLQLAARMTRQRLWQIIGFLAFVALIFVVTTIRDEVRALRDDLAERNDPASLLAGTPLQVPPGEQTCAIGQPLAPERGSAFTFRYRRRSSTCRCSSRCCPGCTSR